MTAHLSGVRGLYLLLSGVLVLAALTYYEARQARLEVIPAITEPIKIDTELDDMQKICTSWTSGGTTIEICTTKNEGETTTSWLTRHREAVDAAKVLWPPD